MHILLQFLPLVVLLPASPLVLFSMLAFDRLVVIEREQFPDAWKKDRRPFTSWRRRPDMPVTFLSWFATQRCMFVWLFVTPPWAREHAEASRYVRRMRTLVALWVFVAMPLFALSGLMSASVAR